MDSISYVNGDHSTMCKRKMCLDSDLATSRFGIAKYSVKNIKTSFEEVEKNSNT